MEAVAKMNEGLRAHMMQVYLLMAGGLGVTALVAAMGWGAGIIPLIQSTPWLGIVLILLPFAPLIALLWGMERYSTTTLYGLYFTIVAALGVTLPLTLAKYTTASIGVVLMTTIAGFLGCSLYGYTTKRDMRPLGNFFCFALFGLLAAMILNIFFASSTMTFIISVAGVVLFAGLTAYDTQRTKDVYYESSSEDGRVRGVITCALNLYLDFMNLFLFLLQILGVKK